jgi:hypothetical protein
MLERFRSRQTDYWQKAARRDVVLGPHTNRSDAAEGSISGRRAQMLIYSLDPWGWAICGFVTLFISFGVFGGKLRSIKCSQRVLVQVGFASLCVPPFGDWWQNVWSASSNTQCMHETTENTSGRPRTANPGPPPFRSLRQSKRYHSP